VDSLGDEHVSNQKFYLCLLSLLAILSANVVGHEMLFSIPTPTSYPPVMILRLGAP